MDLTDQPDFDYSSDFDDRIDAEIEAIDFDSEENDSSVEEDGFYRHIEDY